MAQNSEINSPHSNIHEVPASSTPPIQVQLPHGFERTKIKLKSEAIRLGIIIVISALIAFGVGAETQTQLRNLVSTQELPATHEVPISTASGASSISQEQSTSLKSLFGNFLSQAKQYAKTKISAVADKSTLYQKVKQENDQLMGIIDETIFWGPFISSFIILLLLLNKLSHLFFADSIEREEKKRLVEAINKLGEKINKLENRSGEKPDTIA